MCYLIIQRILRTRIHHSVPLCYRIRGRINIERNKIFSKKFCCTAFGVKSERKLSFSAQSEAYIYVSTVIFSCSVVNHFATCSCITKETEK